MQRAIELLQQSKELVPQKKAMLGFDGFLDNLVKLVKSKDTAFNPTFFDTIKEFAEHIHAKSGLSCGVEVEPQLKKIGGNCPIISNALANMGVKVNCLGSLGYPEVLEAFKQGMSSNCNLYSVGAPGETTALEFNDGKIMLSLRKPLRNITFESITERLPAKLLEQCMLQSDFIGFVNWNGTVHLNDIWNKLLQTIVVKHKPSRTQVLFCDLSDISSRAASDIRDGMHSLMAFKPYYKVVLGLNENETRLLYKALFGADDLHVTVHQKGERIFEHCKPDALIIHAMHFAVAFNGSVPVQVNTLHTPQPKISTGGGDNFNAGLALGLLLDADLESLLYIANATSGYYVRQASSPSLENIIATLKKWEANAI